MPPQQIFIEFDFKVLERSGPNHEGSDLKKLTDSLHTKARRLASNAWLSFIAATLLVATNSSVLAQRNVTLVWDASRDMTIENYVVYSGIRSGFYTRSTPSGGKTNVTIGGLKEGLTYYFCVTAIDWAGAESSPSAEIQYAGPCSGRIVNLTAASVTGPVPGLKLAVPTIPGRKYVILASEDLQTWTPAWTSSIASAHAVISFVDTNAASSHRQFYRTEVTGPYFELEGALTVSSVSESTNVARIGFIAETNVAYELQSSANGVIWKTVWSDPMIRTEGWTELLDHQTNSVTSRRYRLLSTPSIAASEETPCPDPANQAPSISDISNQETYRGIPTLPIPLSLFDPDTPLSQLELSANSSNPSLLPPGQIKFAGSGTNRTVKLTPVSGKSGSVIVEIFVSDGNSTAATAFALLIRPDVPTEFPISIQARGAGTVQPNRDGQSLRVGKRYTITAVPAKGQIFLGWTGDIESSSSKLSFVMSPRLTLEAVFGVNPFFAIQGAYSGLFHEDDSFRPDRAGSFTVSTTERGTYSGKLALGAKTYSFSGQLDMERNGTNIIARIGASPLRIEMSFGGGDSDQANGRVTDGFWQAPLRGYRPTYNSKSHPAPFAGAYTLAIPGQDSSILGPEGAGIGVANIDGNGRATFAGTLADGTKVSLKSALSKNGEWAFHAPLYSKLGVLHGWQNITLDASNSVHGTMHWAKPNLPKTRQYPGGFTVKTVTTGSRYIRPTPTTAPVLKLEETDLVFSGGNLLNTFTNHIALIEKNRIANLSSNKLSMTFTLSKGLFGGKVTEPATGKSLSFKGALLQDRDCGVGFLLGTNLSAHVGFSP